MDEEIIENWKLLKEEEQKRHAQSKNDNTAFLITAMPAHFEMRNNGETLIFREKGYPKVDFYPSTGRWRIPGKRKTYGVGAEFFMNWYEKQKEG